MCAVESELTLVDQSAVLREAIEVQREILARMDALQSTQLELVDAVGDLNRTMLELECRDKVVAYFGCILRCPEVVSLNDLWGQLEAVLPPDVLTDLLLVDLVVEGVPRQAPQAGKVWLAIEVSNIVDDGDVNRARRRAAALREAGYRAFPLVAGRKINLQAEDAAKSGPVVVLQDGQVYHWQTILESLS